MPTLPARWPSFVTGVPREEHEKQVAKRYVDSIGNEEMSNEVMIRRLD